MKEIIEKQWHHQPEAEVIETFETALETGLDTIEAGQRTEQFGSSP
jgi:hypothetical protein